KVSVCSLGLPYAAMASAAWRGSPSHAAQPASACGCQILVHVRARIRSRACATDLPALIDGASTNRYDSAAMPTATIADVTITSRFPQTWVGTVGRQITASKAQT